MCIQWIPGHEQGGNALYYLYCERRLTVCILDDIILNINRSRAISDDVNIIMRARGGGLGHDANISMN